MALCKLKECPSADICLSNSKFSYCPYSVLICIRAYFGIPIALNYKYINLGSLYYGTVKLPVELFDLVLWSEVGAQT